MFNRLVKDLLNKPLVLLMALILTVAQVLLTIYLPVLIGQAIDTVIINKTGSALQDILFQMALLILLNTFLQWLSPLIFNQLIFSYAHKLRQDTIAKIHRLTIAYLDKNSVGDMVSRVTTDVEQLTNGLIMVFNQFFIGLLTIIFTILTMTNLDFMMSSLVIVLTPLSLFLARYISKKSYYLYRQQTEARGEQTQLIEEMISQSNIVQGFNAQKQAYSSFQELNNTYAKHSLGAIFYSSIVNPLTRFINAIIYALLIGVGAFRIMYGSFTVGQLTTFLNFVNQYTKPFNDVSSVMAELQSALACAERLYAILDEKEVDEETLFKKLDADMVKGHIQFQDISFSYVPSKSLINNLSLYIPAGSKVAIVGPTGAGKSTLINLLMRFYEPDRGSILLDGIPITNYGREEFRNQVGMVLQETWLKEASVHDNIAYANPLASREEVIAAAKTANADFFIRQLPKGYDTVLEDFGKNLSQGQRQLLTIARLFLKEPQILILDEATSSIDTRTELLVQAAFEKLMIGKTSFIIAHRLSTIQTADMILVMVNGDIVEHGSHDFLMSLKGFYYQMQTTNMN